ncbi:MMPL family transporter [Pyxidicoccus parkwayensis]|uniref:MMPL family transporter n=1 Tax=Pyxidicoccus parkwayensis TaxID=2813578 RepID=A0ABX7PA55_9BACT|nr:MMPL family transporter [Pyxidicoccus parkwaysis]QSQ27322.1 MMPL family transporter [Pyxidicoccus parkwaysis]
MDALARRLVGGLLRHRRAVLGTAVLLTLVGTVFTIRLYGDLRSEVEELLPMSAPSVVAARELTPRLYDVSNLSVVLEGEDPAAIQRFADALAERLRALPPTVIRSVDYRIDAERAFLRNFGLFYLSIEDLQTVLQRVRARIQWERQHANPLFVDLLGEGPPPLDFQDIASHYGGALTSVQRFRDDYYQTPDGRRLVMLVRPPEASTGYAFNRALLERVQAEVAALEPRVPVPGLRVGYDGEVATMTEEQAALREDLVTSGLVVLAGVTLVLWLYFRRWRALAAIIASLAVGCAITFGLGELLIGNLNANTAFLGSIVVGNGINAAIIFMARYMEERRAGAPAELAVPTTWLGTVAPTFVASFAAGLAYLSLAVTSFRGFNQFGIIGGLGMALCWLSTYLFLPPLLLVLESRRPLDFTDVRGAARLTSLLMRLLDRRRGLVQGVSLLLLTASGVAMATYRGDLVESDFNKLRARHSQQSGSIYWGHRVDEVFQTYLTPIVIAADTPEDLERVVEVLDAKQRTLGPEAPLREVRTARTVLPADAEAKLPLLRELRALMPDSRLSLLPEDQRQKAEQFRPPEDVHPPRWEDLPPSIREPLTERDGTVGRVALAFPARVGAIDVTYGRQLTDVVRGAIHDAGGHALATGRPLLIADIGRAILLDGPRATLLALIAVSVLVLGVLRRVRPAATVLAGLLMGASWLVGLAAAMRLRVNFLNFVVLPITFGIGVDYAANLVLRLRQEGPGSLARVMADTGGAVALCSSTTIIGYASLILSDNQALAGFGLLASLGEVACLTAALLALPALFLGPRPRTP